MPILVRLALLFCFILLNLPTTAQQIWLKATAPNTVTPPIQSPVGLLSVADSLLKANSTDAFALLTFKQMPTPAVKAEVARYFELLEYLPDLTWYCRVVKLPANEVVLSSFNIQAITPIEARYKYRLSPFDPDFPDYAQATNGVGLKVHIFTATQTLSKRAQQLQALGAEITLLDPLSASIEIKLAPLLWQVLTQQAYVYWIEPQSPAVEGHNERERTNHRVPLVNQLSAYGLSGLGVIVGEWDGTSALPHIDYDERHVAKEAWANNSNGQHATHVAGTVLGAGIRNPQAAGMAPKASLFSWGFNGNVTLEMDSGTAQHGLEMTQNSYGYNTTGDNCTVRGTYDGTSRGLDLLVMKYPNLLHVFSGGNSRGNNCRPGGYGTVGSGYQAAKNNLTVAASTHLDGNSWFHSYGPVRDGRLKPEITAVGVDVYSTFPFNNYQGGYNGTSMACPGTSGSAALILEWYKNQFGSQPPAHLLKGVLCNGADELGRPGPDFMYGFGRLNSYRSLRIFENQTFRIDSVGHNQTFVDSFTLTQAHYELKVMLNWDDPAAVASSAKTLINNLDLKLITPAGDTLLPWVCDFNQVTNNAIRQIDTLNNTEQVTLFAPSAGTYKILVNGTQVSTTTQRFSVNWLAQDTMLMVVYPNGGEKWNAPSNAANAQVLRWDANGLSGNALLEYSLDSGATWATIQNNVNVNNLAYTWNNAPSNLKSNQALFRISVGNYSDQSDRVFDIYTQMPSPTAVICDKQVHLKWNALSDAKYYRVWMNLNGEMTPIDTTEKTFYTIRNLINDSTYWFAVSAIGLGNEEGLRSWGVPFIPKETPKPPQYDSLSPDPRICSGSPLNLFAKVSSSSAINHYWQRSADSGKTWQFAGSNADTLQINGVNQQMNGHWFRLLSINQCESHDYSDTIRPRIDSIPAYQYQDSIITLCIGQDSNTMILFDSADITGLNWYFYQSLTSSGLPIAGDTLNFKSFVNSNPADSGYYRVHFDNACGLYPTPDAVRLNIREPLSALLNTDTTVCHLEVFTLYPDKTGGLATNYQLYWPQLNAISDSASFQFTQDTFVRVVLSDACTSSPDTAEMRIFVRDPLQLSLQSDTLICSGNQLNIKALATGGYAPNYQFTFNGSASQTADSIALAHGFSGWYQVTVSDQCSAPIASDSQFIKSIYPAQFSLSNDTTLCFGQQSTLRIQLLNGDIPFIQTAWLNGSNINDSTALSDPSGDKWYVAQVTDRCQSTFDSVFIQHLQPLQLNAVADTLICHQQALTKTLQAQGGVVANYQFEWSDGFIGDSRTWSPNGQIAYSVIVSDQCSPNDTILFNINERSPLSLDLGSDLSVCLNQSTVIRTTNSGGVSTQYAWHWDGVRRADSIIQNVNGPLSIVVRLSDNCSPDVYDSIQITPLRVQFPTPQLNKSLFCLNDTLSVNLNGSATAVEWELSNGQTFNTENWLYPLSQTGVFSIQLRMTDAQGCTADTTFANAYEVINLPSAAFTLNNTLLETTEEVEANALDFSATQYQWFLSNGQSASGTNWRNSFEDTGLYLLQLVVSNRAGCIDSSTQSFYIFENPQAHFATAFTPNNDGLNQSFGPVYINLSQAEMRIYNRWGQLVFECNQPQACQWDGRLPDGTPAPQGVYVVSFKGQSPQRERITYKGTVTLIR